MQRNIYNRRNRSTAESEVRKDGKNERNGFCKEDAGKRYQECFKILMRYGWSYEREEADLVYGNHELYKKES